jgi:hypothetical protein
LIAALWAQAEYSKLSFFFEDFGAGSQAKIENLG